MVLKVKTKGYLDLKDGRVDITDPCYNKDRGSSGARGMFAKAGISEGMTDEQIINTVYDYEATHITAGEYTAACRQRMVLEKRMILENFL